MAEQRSTILQNIQPGYKGKDVRSESSTINLRASFPNSPIHKEELTDKERQESFQKLVLDGNLEDNVEVAGTVVRGGPGHGTNSYNRDFKGTAQNPVPNLDDVETGGGGLPASPFVPNLASPGPGSANAADQPVYTGDLPDSQLKVNFGSGIGGLVSPHKTSLEISKQTVLGAYISGRSYQGSDGKA